MSDGLPTYPDDGLHRFVVTPLDEGLEAALEGGTVVLDDAPDLTSSRWTVPFEHLDLVPDDAMLVFEEGVPGYHDPSGAFVAIDGSRLGSTATRSYGHPTIDALAALDEVVTVAAIGDGSFALTTTDPDALTNWRIAVAEDPPFGFGSDPYGPYQWSLDNTGDNLDSLALPSRPIQVADADIDGTEAAGAPAGDGVVVAVVDSGVDFGHPDLAGAAWTNDDEVCDNGLDDDGNGYVDDCSGWDFAADDNEPYSTGHIAHGTHVAGIIAASAGNGIGITGAAPDVRIMDLSVSASGTITASSIARAVRYAVDNGADVINLSLGSAPGVPLSAVSPIVEAVIHAEENGVLVVAAAGNHGVDITSQAVYPASIETTNLLVVGASTPAETKASFSNHGTTVDLFAPGELILSTVPGGEYSFMSGTSQAAPLTAAVAARLLGQSPTATPSAVIEQIVGTADEFDGYRDLASSPVRLNAARAVGVDPDDPSAAADAMAPMVSVSGLASATPDAVAARIELNPPGGQFNQPFHWEATLVTMLEDGVYAVVDHELTIGGEPLTTNDRGAVRLAGKAATDADLRTALPPGRYGLVVEAVPDVDPDARLTDAYITVFDLGEDEGDTGGSDTTIDVSPTPLDDETELPTTTVPDGGASDDPGSSGTTGSTSGSTTTASPADSTGSSGSSGAGSSGSSGDQGSTSSDSPGSTGSSATSAPGRPVGTAPDDDGPSTTTTSPRSETTRRAETTTTAPPGTSPDRGRPDRDDESTTTTDPGSGGTPPGDSPSGEVPDSVGPADVSDGEWSIQAITPRFGAVSFENVVSISGDFPRAVHVWFGSEPGEVYYQTSTWLLVRTPRSATPGAIDVTLRTNSDGVVLTVPDGFTYLGEDDRPPTIDPGTSTGGGEVGDGSGEPGTPADDPVGDVPVDPGDDVIGPGPGDDPAVDLPIPTPSDDDDADDDGRKNRDRGRDRGRDNDDENERPRTRNRQARAVPIGDPVDLGNGLVGRSLTGLTAIGDIASCTADPCETQTISGPRNTKSVDKSSAGRSRGAGR